MGDGGLRVDGWLTVEVKIKLKMEDGRQQILEGVIPSLLSLLIGDQVLTPHHRPQTTGDHHGVMICLVMSCAKRDWNMEARRDLHQGKGACTARITAPLEMQLYWDKTTLADNLICSNLE